jgi:hypothetical protein
MPRLSGIRIVLALSAVVAAMLPAMALAQDDPNDMPLGDVARNLRKRGPQVKPVVDDDNLPQIMERAESSHAPGRALQFLMAGESKGFQIAAPDVTCSLSFSANVKSLLSGQYSQMDMPPSETIKLQAQATIEGDTLTVPVFNGTSWHLSELAIALTVVRKIPEIVTDPLEQVRAEKKPDTTVIYRMRAVSPPWERAVFSAPLNIDLAPEDEWHWAIVQAKGYPPESYPPVDRKSVEAKSDSPTPSVPPSLTDPESPLAVTPQRP